MSPSSPNEIELWGAGTARTLRPIWVAEELGIEYRLHPIGPRTGETRTAEYTRLNPKQKIPLLVAGPVKLSESVAICRFLIDAFRGDAIWRPRTPIERASEDDWCCYVYGEIDETSLYVMRRHRDLAQVYGDAPQAVQAAAEYLERHLRVLEAHLKESEHLMSQGFGLADVLLVSCLDWAVAYGLDLPPAVAAYRQHVSQRPAYQRAMRVNYRTRV